MPSRNFKGMDLERKASNYYSTLGWSTQQRWHFRDGREIDVYGTKLDYLTGKSYLLVECKNTARVSRADVEYFAKKVLNFAQSLTRASPFGGSPAIYAVIVHSGDVSAELESWAAGLDPPIQFRFMD
jgi:hypothetical protein